MAKSVNASWLGLPQAKNPRKRIKQALIRSRVMQQQQQEQEEQEEEEEEKREESVEALLDYM
ncbi:hypothetical protein GJ744_005751 [Endocarpon pusillum]|uniref:Uncharacterized protein n=1 Tax=Endocarpon pusillum TaxID=364733 RepID=A0A8H7APY1_9EURO|nr:hypothetical protein GJ744_005751 [Endocarpon pusillum]